MSTQLDCFVIFETEIYLSSSCQLVQICQSERIRIKDALGPNLDGDGKEKPPAGGEDLSRVEVEQGQGETCGQAGDQLREAVEDLRAGFGIFLLWARFDMACIKHPMEVTHDTLPSEALLLCVSVCECRGGGCTSSIGH